MLSRQGGVATLDERGGMCLGVMEDSEYQSSKVTLSDGDVLFLYTDGVTEAMDSGDNIYSDGALKRAAAQQNSRRHESYY